MTRAVSLDRDKDALDVTIASGGTTSEAIGITQATAAGVQFPAALTSVTMGFTASSEKAGTYATVYDELGAAVSVPVAASRCVPIPAVVLIYRYIKIVLGSAELADRALVVTLNN